MGPPVKMPPTPHSPRTRRSVPQQKAQPGFPNTDCPNRKTAPSYTCCWESPPCAGAAGTALVRRLSGNSALHFIHFQTDGCLHTRPPHHNKHTLGPTRHFFFHSGAAANWFSSSTREPLSQHDAAGDAWRVAAQIVPDKLRVFHMCPVSPSIKSSLLMVFSGDDVKVRWCSSRNGEFAVVTRSCCRLSDDLLIAKGQSQLAHATFFPLFLHICSCFFLPLIKTSTGQQVLNEEACNQFGKIAHELQLITKSYQTRGLQTRQWPQFCVQTVSVRKHSRHH